MTYIHPVFILVFFYLFFRQYRSGKEIIQLRENSPQYETRSDRIKSHRISAFILLTVSIAGFLGGILAVRYVLEIDEPFGRTYGHGFFGILIISSLLVTIILGQTIKRIIKPKFRDRFLSFHSNMNFVTMAFFLLSAVSGLVILIRGPS